MVYRSSSCSLVDGSDVDRNIDIVDDWNGDWDSHWDRDWNADRHVDSVLHDLGHSDWNRDWHIDVDGFLDLLLNDDVVGARHMNSHSVRNTNMVNHRNRARNANGLNSLDWNNHRSSLRDSIGSVHRHLSGLDNLDRPGNRNLLNNILLNNDWMRNFNLFWHSLRLIDRNRNLVWHDLLNRNNNLDGSWDLHLIDNLHSLWDIDGLGLCDRHWVRNVHRNAQLTGTAIGLATGTACGTLTAT